MDTETTPPPTESATGDRAETTDRPRRRQLFDPETVVIGWRDVACVLPLVVIPIYAYASQPLTGPLIGSHPVLLAFLRGSLSAIIVCGSNVRIGVVPLWQAMAAPLPIIMLADPFYYWAGRRYGRPVLEFYRDQSPRYARLIGRAERAFARYGVLLVLVNPFLPFGALIFFLAGETRMRLSLLIVADTIANLAWIGLLVGLGYGLGQRGVDVASAISRYGTYVAIGSLALAVLWFVVQARRGREAAREL